MQELRQLLRRFLAREIGLDELTRRFATLLERDGDLAAPAAAWLDAGEQDGMLSPTVSGALKNVIVSHLAAHADGPDPRDSGVFGPGDEDPSPSPVVLPPPSTRVRRTTASPASQATPATADRTMLATRAGTALGGDGTRIATNVPSRVDTILRIGSVVGDRYELVGQLGSGGMGTVFKAKDRLREAAQDRNPFIALKVLSEKFKEHPDSMIALQREARRAQSLAHPNVITVHEFFRDGPHFYMTMELLTGHPLDHLVKTKLKDGVPLAEAWPIIEGVSNALQYGHEQGVVHSDIKPGNIFVCTNNTVKVLDFGISRPMQATDIPESEHTVFDARKRLGSLTPSYASLEMWNQDTPDPRDDIYALACVCYVLLTGQHPFGGASAKKAFEHGLEPKRIPSLSRGQWSAISRGLALQRADRIGSVAEFTTLLEPESANRSRRRYVAIAAAAVLVIGAGAGLRQFQLSIEESMQDSPLFAVAPTAPAEPVELTAEEAEELRSLVTLAREDFEYVVDNMTDGWTAVDIDYTLRLSSTSVLANLDMALKLDPYDDEALAVRGDVLELYSGKASDYLEERDYDAALLMAETAKSISDGVEIRRLISRICERAPDGCVP